jgi:hypothetical protein
VHTSRPMRPSSNAICASLVVIVVTASSLYAADTPDPAKDVVAVAVQRDDHSIRMATKRAAFPFTGWRRMTLEAPPNLERVVLSRSGTKILAVFGERLQYVDLTNIDINGGKNQHHLGKTDPFGLQQGRQYSLFSDANLANDSDPVLLASTTLEDGEIAASNQDGGILRVSKTGTLSTSELDAPYVGHFEFAPPITVRRLNDAFDDLSIVGGVTGGAFPFVIVFHSQNIYVVEDLNGVQSQRYARKRTAMLAAAMMASLPKQQRVLDRERFDEKRLDDLATDLPGGADVEWTFYPVVPDVRLYAPVLLFAADEPVFPSSVDIWETLKLEDRKSLLYRRTEDWQGLLEEYRQNRPRYAPLCSMYYSTSDASGRRYSYDGSWLIEYWFYYPFDLFGLDQHLHDTEHLFVEVDKLQGRIRRVIGAAHGRTTSNNVYVASRSTDGVALPLHAIVERGKHATAVDINHDGMFTPGIDENTAVERSNVWGIRDVTGGTDDAFQKYESGMMLRRDDAYAGVPLESREVWSGIADRALRNSDLGVTCALLPFPYQHPVSLKAKNKTATANAAAAMLIEDGDAKSPEAALKPWSFPRLLVRVGWDRGVGDGGGFALDEVLSAQLLSSIFNNVFGAEMKFPGRVSFGYSIRRVDGGVFESGTRLMYSSRLMYERLTSNLFGYYTGLQLTPTGNWYAIGSMFEFPDSWPIHTNTNLSFGVGFKDGEPPRLDFQVRIGVARAFGRGYGIF